MNDCVFCRIIAGAIPSEFVYADAALVAFLDIAPITAGHTLLVPRKHVERYEDLSQELSHALAEALQKLAPRIAETVGARDYNLGLNNGTGAGQIIPHVHWHIIPRFQDDGLKHWPGNRMEESELADRARVIRDSLQNV